ncbi:MAG TPA: RsmB/NOP family class I SAM-dependent RNA methyltransferase [Rhizomicrobium sp.]|jgi:16S rRNA (cytosine967-C5)-methyltransferase|nr:RsmB/NOP family class I SAM-dependent RNA methyltransferase [Rhizomicrobium sp.]
MTPAARLQSAIEILDALEQTNRPADRFLRDWFRVRRYAGAKDRAAVGERVFSVQRRRASLAWRMNDESPRALVLASLAAEGCDVAVIELLFSGNGYGPPPLSDAERAALSSPRRDAPPLWVQREFPPFLEHELTRSLGQNLLDEMRAMGERAPIDLRANTLKASRDDVLAELRAEGFAAEATPCAPHGIRIVEHAGASALSRSRAYLDGRFEFQDEAAQIASLLCAAKPGERILDPAAGAGGKALAIAAEMSNRGLIVARDYDPTRLAQFAPRAARAGVTIIREEAAGADMPDPAFDTVFVDAPCSGSGAWRRQPEQKWRLTPQRLAELQSIQDQLLDEAARAKTVRIVYATCSLLACENEDRVSAFLARHPEFVIRPVADVWSEATGTPPSPGMHDFFRATPNTTGTDGFFAAVLARQD